MSVAALQPQAPLQPYCVETARGPVYFYADTPRPPVFMFHGFMRTPRQFWREMFPGAAFGLLPGYNDAPALSDVSVETWAEAWREAFGFIGEPEAVIGESLGAMLAMCLPAGRCVAIEPLLSVEDLWPQHVAMRRARARGVAISSEHEALFARPYDWVLDRISAPTLVIAGDEPLLPPRPLKSAPSLLSDADFARYERHPLVTAQRIAGGHTLMDENPNGVAALTREFLRSLT